MNTNKQKVARYLNQLADGLEQSYIGNLNYTLPISKEMQIVLKQVTGQPVKQKTEDQRSEALTNWQQPDSTQFVAKQQEGTQQNKAPEPAQQESKTDSPIILSQQQSCEEIAKDAPNLSTLNVRLRGCMRCPLANERQTIVFGMGNEKADLLFIGEGPGADEDQQGKPFVGKAGKLLTQLIRSIGLARQAIYLGNVVKCRPPGNRDPHIEEIESCIPILKKQIELIQPKLIVTLGNIATKNLIADAPGITKAAGNIYQFNNIPVIPLFHPAFLLRQQSYLEQSWVYMQIIRKHLI